LGRARRHPKRVLAETHVLGYSQGERRGSMTVTINGLVLMLIVATSFALGYGSAVLAQKVRNRIP
jgi:hypothetical protein